MKYPSDREYLPTTFPSNYNYPWSASPPDYSPHPLPVGPVPLGTKRYYIFGNRRVVK